MFLEVWLMEMTFSIVLVWQLSRRHSNPNQWREVEAGHSIVLWSFWLGGSATPGWGRTSGTSSRATAI